MTRKQMSLCNLLIKMSEIMDNIEGPGDAMAGAVHDYCTCSGRGCDECNYNEVWDEICDVMGELTEKEMEEMQHLFLGLVRLDGRIDEVHTDVKVEIPGEESMN